MITVFLLTEMCVVPYRPKMRWLMVFAWFQAITFSEAFRKPATMDFEQVLTKNTVNPECFMNVVSYLSACFLIEWLV